MGIVIALAMGHFLAVVALPDVWPFSADRVQALFDLDGEAAPGAFFSALALLACAGAGAFVAAAEPERAIRRFWLIAAALAAFLAVDEAVALHEQFGAIGKPLTGGRGVFTISWWAVYPLFLAPVVALLAPGLLRQSAATRNRLLAAGALYVGVVIGFEIAQSLARDEFVSALGLRGADGIDWTAYAQSLASPAGQTYEMRQHWLTLGEEPLEMAAVALALRAALLRAAELGASLRLTAGA